MMPLMMPLPSGPRELARHNTHPGLALDKFPESWDSDGVTKGLSERVQRPVIDQVVRLSNAPPLPPPDYAALFNRWRSTIGGEGFTGTTAGPLTLHLARASALENAGICFHRVYGFVYLPGTCLKGLARAFACEIWLGEQPDKAAAWETINAVFGVAPSPWLNDLAKKHNQPAPKVAASGAIVFHDAWPERWPRLVTDILNNHHPEYYSGISKSGQKFPPPGDWEDPIPVYFLSVEPGTPFRFAVAKRRDDVPNEVLTLAREWLIGGLTQLGAGAKTASGYGDFTVEEPKVAPVKSPRRPTFEATLELVTPAFLAGANQQAEDCDLRPSILRGQLRWWWRTLHAGFVSVEDLRKMEAAIWGDTKTGGAVRVTVRKVPGTRRVQTYDRRQVMRDHRIPQPTDGSIPGLAYHSYGMDEAKGRRCYVEAGAKWNVTVTARANRFCEQSVAAELILQQATAALHLLTRFGGVGAKGRKGFGSFADLRGFDVEAIHRVAEEYRSTCGFGSVFNETTARSPSLQLMGTPIEVPNGGTNPWLALNELAASVQQFVKGVQPKHCRRWLGLPRRLRGVTGPRLQHESRHASPALFHFTRATDGSLVARAVAFPAGELPNLNDSRRILTDLLAAVASDLPRRFAAIIPPSTPPNPRPPSPPPRLPGAVQVQVTLLERKEKTGPNAFSVQEDGKPKGMLVHGTPPSPLPVVGERVTVYREATSNSNNPTYRWSPPTPPSPPTRSNKRR